MTTLEKRIHIYISPLKTAALNLLEMVQQYSNPWSGGCIGTTFTALGDLWAGTHDRRGQEDVSLCVCVVTALLRSNSHATQFTHLNSTIQYFFSTFTDINHHNQF